jgi:hypothetical protein
LGAGGGAEGDQLGLGERKSESCAVPLLGGPGWPIQTELMPSTNFIRVLPAFFRFFYVNHVIRFSFRSHAKILLQLSKQKMTDGNVFLKIYMQWCGL